MASKAAKPEESVSQLVFWPLHFAWRFSLGLVLLSLFAVVFWVIAYRMGWVSVEEALLVRNNSMAQSSSPKLAAFLANEMYGVYFKATGIHALALSQEVSASASGIARMLRQFPNEVAMSMLAAQNYGIRLANVIVMIPLGLFVAMLAFIDGRAERAIRTASLGHESGSKYRLSKKYGGVLFPPLIGLMYLAMPLDIDSGTVLVPALLFMTFALRTHVKYFKKHF